MSKMYADSSNQQVVDFKDLILKVNFFIIQLNYRLDILFIEKLKDATEVGLYSLGVSIAEQLWQLPLAISIVVFSRTANAEDQSEMTSMTTALLRLSFLFSIIVAVSLYFLVPYVIPWVFGDEYIPSIRIIQLILPGVIMVVIFRILSGQIAGLGKPEVALYIFLPALVLNIILNLLWIPAYGGEGAAMATNVSYTAGSLGYMIAYSRIVKVPLKEIIKYRKSDFTQVKQLIKGLRK